MYAYCVVYASPVVYASHVVYAFYSVYVSAVCMHRGGSVFFHFLENTRRKGIKFSEYLITYEVDVQLTILPFQTIGNILII